MAFSLAACLLGLAATLPCPAADSWWKGALHQHTRWSDGDDFPEMVLLWYKTSGFHFVGLSDHNTLLEGEKWVEAAARHPQALQKYQALFGTNWVRTATTNAKTFVRLRTQAELRPLFEEPNRFLLLPNEEVSDHYDKAAIHINALNLQRVIPPQSGTHVVSTLQNNVNAIVAQGQTIPIINHPNWVWSLTAEDLMQIRHGRFFEVYNGHGGTKSFGEEPRPGTDRIWDIALTRRLTEFTPEPLYGVAADDAHNYHEFGFGKHNPGRGWVMVRASKLTIPKLMQAMSDGDFYSSTGVQLRDVRRGKKQYALVIQGEKGVTYTTQFIGTRKGFDSRSEPVLDPKGAPLHTTRRYSPTIGMVLAEVPGLNPSYQLQGDELYVRAKVISSKIKASPIVTNEVELAWTQPWIR